jgi:hypothetical protein
LTVQKQREGQTYAFGEGAGWRLGPESRGPVEICNCAFDVPHPKLHLTCVVIPNGRKVLQPECRSFGGHSQALIDYQIR